LPLLLNSQAHISIPYLFTETVKSRTSVVEISREVLLLGPLITAHRLVVWIPPFLSPPVEFIIPFYTALQATLYSNFCVSETTYWILLLIRLIDTYAVSLSCPFSPVFDQIHSSISPDTIIYSLRPALVTTAVEPVSSFATFTSFRVFFIHLLLTGFTFRPHHHSTTRVNSLKALPKLCLNTAHRPVSSSFLVSSPHLQHLSPLA
jgi:hypothetical protein